MTDFANIALSLRMIVQRALPEADRMRLAVAGLNGGPYPGCQQAVIDEFHDLERLAEAAKFFLDHIPHETEIRRLIEPEEARRAAAQ